MSQLPHLTPPPERSVAIRARRRRLVPAFIIMAIVLFLATEAMLYYRWATVNEPTCVLIVDGAEPLRGADVTISGPRLPQPYQSVMGKGERFELPFYLDPDHYLITVTLKGKDVFHANIAVSPPGNRIDLTRLDVPVTDSATTQSQ